MSKQNEKKQRRTLPRWTGYVSLPLAFLAYFLLDVTLRYTYGSAAAVEFTAWPPFVFSALWALLLTGIAALLPRVPRKLWLGITFFIFAAECVAHAALYKLTGTVFSFQSLAYAEDGARFFSFAYLNIRKAAWLGIGICAVLMALSAVLSPRQGYALRRVIPAVLVVAVSVAGICIAHHALYQDKTRESITWSVALGEESLSERYSRLDRANDCLMTSGLYQFTWRSAAAFLSPDNPKSPTEYAALDKYYAAHPKTTDSPDAGALEGQNLIMILMESIDTWMVTPEYMPNLYALMHQSVSFTNYYAPMYIPAATFNTEFAANTGLAAPTIGISNDAYTSYAFPYSLAHLFSGAGYTANSFHGATPAIYNRGAIHKNFGYEAYHSYVDMGMDNYMLDSQMARAHALYAPDEPFFSFILTYSGHGPYNQELAAISDPHLEQAEAAIDYDAIDFPSESDRTEYTLAVAHAMETDDFIGALMENLEADGHADDTAIVFYGDHYCKYMTNTEFVMAIKGAPNRDLLTRVPFGIWSKQLVPRAVDTAVSILDIVPTVVSLYGFDVDLRYYIGSDMLSSDAGLVSLADAHWFDGATYYDGTRYYDATAWANHEIPAPLIPLQTPPAGAEDNTAEAAERLDIAWRTFRSDYFAYLETK